MALTMANEYMLYALSTLIVSLHFFRIIPFSACS